MYIIGQVRIDGCTFWVISSSHAIRMRSAVAGESKSNTWLAPVSDRAALIACLIAKNMLEAKNSGGSPTAYDKRNSFGSPNAVEQLEFRTFDE